MKIAIISDTHDNVANLKKAADYIKKEKIKTIIHCGDIFKPETIKEGLKGFEGKIHLIFSPADADFSKIPRDSFRDIKGVKVCEEFGEIKIKKGPLIAFCHFPEIVGKLAQTQKYNLIFFGHTHQPWESRIGKSRLVNPGNLAGLFYKATFATYETKNDKLELILLEKL